MVETLNDVLGSICNHRFFTKRIRSRHIDNVWLDFTCRHAHKKLAMSLFYLFILCTRVYWVSYDNFLSIKKKHCLS